MQTSEPIPNTRRGILRSGVAILALAGTTAATGASAATPAGAADDAALIALCAELDQAGAAIRAFDASNDGDQARCNALCERWYVALGAVIAVRPATAAGLRAKGASALAAMRSSIVLDHIEQEERFAMNVLADLVGVPYWQPAEEES